MASIKIRGREYPLRMDLHAMEAIEKEYGDIKGAMEEFRNRNGRTRKISNVKMMFRVMANSGLRRQGLRACTPRPSAAERRTTRCTTPTKRNWRSAKKTDEPAGDAGR